MLSTHVDPQNDQYDTAGLAVSNSRQASVGIVKLTALNAYAVS